MALFQRNPHETSKLPLYTLGSNKTVLIIGLGNPGKEYESTRHNVGFAIADNFAQENNFPAWIVKKDLQCQMTMANLGDSRVILMKPTTFMNLSGEAAQAVQHFYKVANSQTVAAYDELAIPFGQLRTRLGGSDAGHNGVKSLIQHIGEDFGRLRIGIGSDLATKKDSADFVLDKFSQQEQKQTPQIIQEAGVLLTEYIFNGELPHDTRTVI